MCDIFEGEGTFGRTVLCNLTQNRLGSDIMRQPTCQSPLYIFGISSMSAMDRHMSYLAWSDLPTNRPLCPAEEIQKWDNLLMTVSALSMYFFNQLNASNQTVHAIAFCRGSDLSTIRALSPQASKSWCQPICQQPVPSISAVLNGLASSWAFNFRPHLQFSHHGPYLGGGTFPPSQFICP